ncbi:MAG: hypothetical protein GY733_15365, partial [bacterium]|nr:hypothetical protein [bacterium]
IVEERWGRWGTTKGGFGLDLSDYRYDIDLGRKRLTRKYGDYVDQDGVGIHVGVEHELPLTVVRALELDLYGGYEFSTYLGVGGGGDYPDGREWEHFANEVHLGLRARLLFDVELDARGTYTRRDYRDASYWALPDAAKGPDREDDAGQADVELSKDLNDFIEFSARYQYTDNGSNTQAFDYKRHIAGAYIELEFR